jgi:ataxia telangiectasia mutated family protein
VRAVVLSGVRIFKRKTTMAVVDHITQTLPRDGEMFEPLANDYLYALDAILAEQSQAERLVIPKGDKSHASHETRERVWDKCVDFCVDYLIKASAPQADPDSTTSQPTNTASSRVSRISQPDESKLKFFEVTWFVILFRCLWNLVRLRNAPIQAKSDDIMALAIQVLEAKGSLSQTSLLAFYMINRVLESVQADATGAANQWVAKLVPLVHHWWSGERLQRRDASIFGFRDEMIKFIYISHPHIEHQLMYPDEAGFYEQIDALSTMLWAEYARRGSGHAYVLRLDDLRFGVGHLPVRSMKTAHFCLLSHNTDTERPWANLECMAILEGLVSRYDASKRERTDLDQELPRKRRRIERQASRLLQRLRSTDPQWQFAALQFIPLLAARGLLPQDEIADLVSILTNMMVDEQPVTTSWAMIACASCVIEMKAGNDRELLRLVSHLAARSVTLPTVSRAACVLLEACLEAGLPWSDVAEDLNNIVTQNGPSLLTDSSVALMTRLFHLRNEKLPGASQSTCNNIIRWVFGRWVPGRWAIIGTPDFFFRTPGFFSR